MRSRKFLPFGVVCLLTCTSAYARVARHSIQADPHPYQNQTMIRQADGLLLGLTAEANDFTWNIPGEDPVVFPNTQLLREKENPLPAITKMGGNYAFFGGNYLETVSADGLFAFIGRMPFTPGIAGGVWFTKAGTGEIVVVDSAGFYFETGEVPQAIRLTGGNFYIDVNHELTTFRSMGSFFQGSDGNTYRNAKGMMTHKTGTEFPDAVQAGGNFFVNRDGGVYVVRSTDGFYFGPFNTDAKPSVLGGNYFIGTDNRLYSISFDGKIFKNGPLPGTPKTRGYSYLVFGDGALLTIDQKGGVHRSVVKLGQKIEKLEGFAAPLEAGSQYLPE